MHLAQSSFTQAFLPCPLDSRRMWPPFWSSPYGPSSRRLLLSWGAPRFLVLAGPTHGGYPSGPARAAGPIPPPYTRTARQGSEPRAAPGHPHMGKRDHEFCLQSVRPVLSSSRLEFCLQSVRPVLSSSRLEVTTRSSSTSGTGQWGTIPPRKPLPP